MKIEQLKESKGVTKVATANLKFVLHLIKNGWSFGVGHKRLRFTAPMIQIN